MLNTILKASKVAAPFSPTDLPTLTAWYDASDASTVLTDANGVYQFNDKSVNGYNLTQTTNSRKPTYVSGNYIDFDRLNVEFLSRSDRLGLAANPDLMYIGVATTPASYSSNDGAGLRWIAIGTEVGGLSVGVGTSGWSWRYNNGFEAYNSAALSTQFLVSFVHPLGGNYASSSFFQNGTEQTATAVSNPTALPTDVGNNSFAIGAESDSLNAATYRCHEWVVLNSSTTSDRQKVEGYLAHKWGLAGSLPTGHPYKNSAP